MPIDIEWPADGQVPWGSDLRGGLDQLVAYVNTLGGGDVDSVNGQTGEVTLDAGDIGAANVNHTHPISDVTLLQGTLDDLAENSLTSDTVGAVFSVATPEAFGAVGDGVTDDTAAILAAIAAAAGGTVVLRRGARYGVTTNLEVGSTALTPIRRATKLVGPATLVPLATFSGDTVVRHTQSAAQAAALSFGYGAGLYDIEIDGSLLPAGSVNGIRFDGAFHPVIDGVNVHHVSGHGWTMPADNAIDAAGDDSYAIIAPVVTRSKFTNCGGWGIYQSRFSAPFTARGVYVNNNAQGGVRITAPNVIWNGGAIAYNGGPGLQFTRSTSAIASTLSQGRFTSVEIDRNSGTDVWFENCFNTVVVSPRLITAETGASYNGGAYITPKLVRFGGTAGMSVFNCSVERPYIRASQHTTNPPLTLFEFNSQATDCFVDRMYELTGSSTARIIGTRSGSRNYVTDSTGAVVFADQVTPPGFTQAYVSNATTVTTVLTDLVFNSVVTDPLDCYDEATGVYTTRGSDGVYSIRGFLTVDAAAATTARTITIYLRVDAGSGYTTSKIIPVQVSGTSTDQVVPFNFTYMATGASVSWKIAVVASTGTALKVGAQSSDYVVCREGGI